MGKVDALISSLIVIISQLVGIVIEIIRFISLFVGEFKNYVRMEKITKFVVFYLFLCSNVCLCKYDNDEFKELLNSTDSSAYLNHGISLLAEDFSSYFTASDINGYYVENGNAKIKIEANENQSITLFNSLEGKAIENIIFEINSTYPLNGDGIIKYMKGTKLYNIIVVINGKMVINSTNEKGSILCNEMIDSNVLVRFTFDEIEVINNKEDSNFGLIYGYIDELGNPKISSNKLIGNAITIRNNKKSSVGLIVGSTSKNLKIAGLFVLVKNEMNVISNNYEDDNIGFIIGYSNNTIDISQSVVDIHVGEINNFGGLIGKEERDITVNTVTIRLYLNHQFNIKTKFGFVAYECVGNVNMHLSYVDILNEININNRILQDEKIVAKEIYVYNGTKSITNSFMTVSDDSIENDGNNTIELFSTYCIPSSTHQTLLDQLNEYARIDVSFITYLLMPFYYNGVYYDLGASYPGSIPLKCPEIYPDPDDEKIEFINTKYEEKSVYFYIKSYKEYEPDPSAEVFPNAAFVIPIYDKNYFTVEPSIIQIVSYGVLYVSPKDVDENITSELSFEVKSQDRFLRVITIKPIKLSIIFKEKTAPLVVSCRFRDDAYIIELIFNKNCVMKGGIEVDKPFAMNDTELLTFDPDTTIDILYYMWVDNTTLNVYYNSSTEDIGYNSQAIIKEGYIFADLESTNSTRGTIRIDPRTALPIVTSSKFIDENTITIEFYAEIKDGIDIYGRKCNEIFSDDSFNPSSMCYLSSPNTITMKLSNPSELFPGNYLHFVSDVIKSSKNHIKGLIGSAQLFSDLQTSLVSKIIVKQLNSVCYDFIIDGSHSGGSLRPLKYIWSSSDPQLNNIVSSMTGPIIIVPKNSLETDKDYDIILEIQSTFDASTASSTQSFRLSSDLVVIIEIEGGERPSFYVIQEAYERGRISLYQCDKSLPKPEIEYNWSIEDEYYNYDLAISDFITIDETRLHFVPYKIPASDYFLTLSCSVNNVEYKKTVTLDVMFITLGIPNKYPQFSSHAKTDPIIIDLSDPNELNLGGNDLNYIWRCIYNTYDYCGYLIPDITASKIEIPGDRLEIGVYELQVNITIDGDTLVHSKTFIREVKDIPFSLVIQNPKSNSTKFTQKDMFQLIGITSINNDEMEYKWIYTNDEKVNPFIGKTNVNKVYVSCENLNPRIPHTIKLEITEGNTKVESLFEFRINEGPYNGYLYVSTLDYKFGENILISTVGWIGEGSFTYRFGVIINNVTYYLQAVYGLANYYYGPLPLGSRQYNYTLTPIVFVKDSYGVVTNTTLNTDGKVIEIYSPPLDIDELSNITEELKYIINDLKNEKYYDYLFPLIEGISSQMKEKSCEVIDCQNESDCIDGHCQCPKGFYGELCENRIPIDGGLSVGYTYGECDHQCGRGLRPKWKECDNPKPEYGGKECEIEIEYEDCIGEKGIVCEDTNGNWSEWSNWSSCSAVCEVYNGRRKYGIQTRNRSCTYPKPSGDGLNCIGNRIETQECNVICESVRKLCPGEYLTRNGTIVGNVCSNRGNCSLSREECKEYEPNCHSKCECNSGFKGEKCEYTDNEYEVRINLNKILLSNIIEASANNVFTLDAIDQQSSVLLSVINPPDQLTIENKTSTVSFIKSSINSMKENISTGLSYETITNFIKSASLLLKDEWKDRKEGEYRMLEQNVIGREIPELLNDISEAHLNQEKSIIPILAETSTFSLKAIKYDGNIELDKYLEGEIQFPESVLNISSDNKVEETNEISIINWLDNPNDDDLGRSNRTAGVSTISILDEEGEEKKMDNLEKPIYFIQRLNDNTNLKTVQCSYYVEGELKSQGLVVMGILDDGESGNKYVLCASTHLSDFSTIRKSILPKMNFVNPISDAKLLSNYNKDNMIVPIILGSVVAICIVAWLLTKVKDLKEIAQVEEHKSNYFKLTGRLDEKEIDIISIQQERKNIFRRFWDKLLDEHSWISPQMGAAENLIVLNRSQRILCLTAQILTSTAVSALFYGSSAENISQIAMTSIISTLCMLPASLLIPSVYKFANGYSSRRSARKAVSSYIVFFNKLKRSVKTLQKKKSRLYLTLLSFLFDGITACFFISFIVILPPGYISLVLFCVYILFIIETASSIIITNERKKKFFFLLVLVNIIIFFVFVALLVVYIFYMNDSSSIPYSIWKSFYNAGPLKDINEYIENSLECCGYSSISDYNTTDCTAPKIMALGIDIIGCESLLVDKFNQYAPLWIIYFTISSLLVLLKIICLFRLMVANINVVEVNLEFEELNRKYKDDKIAKEKIEKIKCILKHRVTRVYYKRKIEYLHWKRQRKIRAGLIILANAFVFMYILIMVYINLLYGVKFTSGQARSWIISSTISMIIDVVIQEPAMILLSTVAITTIGSIFLIIFFDLLLLLLLH